MKITSLGHSGFLIQTIDYMIIIDWVEENENRLPDVVKEAKKVFVMSTHGHHDHFSKSIFNISKTCKNVVYILSKDIEDIVNDKQTELKIHYINKGETFIDNETNFGVKAYGTTDIGVSFLMKIEGKNVFHAGDLNNWHWEKESTEEEIEEAEKMFHEELDYLYEDVDEMSVAMFPVDARMEGDYARGARQFLQKFRVCNFIPMHTWGMWDKSFDTKQYRNETLGKCICLMPGDCVTLE